MFGSLLQFPKIDRMASDADGDMRPKCTYCGLPVDGLPDTVVRAREFRVVCSDGCAVALGKLRRRA